MSSDETARTSGEFRDMAGMQLTIPNLAPVYADYATLPG